MCFLPFSPLANLKPVGIWAFVFESHSDEGEEKKYLTTLFLYERHKTCMGKNARMQLVAKLSAAKNARLPSYNSQVGFIHTRQLELAPRKGRRHD